MCMSARPFGAIIFRPVTAAGAAVQEDVVVTDIEGGAATAIKLLSGQGVRLVNTYGSQVVDTWSLATADTTEYLSVEHTRRMLSRLYPREGDPLYSNRRNALMTIERDTSGCRHDMLLACCDSWLYKFYGCPPAHASCHDNFLGALAAHGIRPTHVPNPVNFWMNVPVEHDSDISLRAPVSKAGDFLVLRALVDVYVVFSACPMDITPVNGEDCRPRPVAYAVLTAAQDRFTGRASSAQS